MFGPIIHHKREGVELLTLKEFKEEVKNHYRALKVEFSEKNDGMFIYNYSKDITFEPWATIAEDLEWFDDAEVVTDKDEEEKVMVWLNVD